MQILDIVGRSENMTAICGGAASVKFDMSCVCSLQVTVISAMGEECAVATKVLANK